MPYHILNVSSEKKECNTYTYKEEISSVPLRKLNGTLGKTNKQSARFVAARLLRRRYDNARKRKCLEFIISRPCFVLLWPLSLLTVARNLLLEVFTHITHTRTRTHSPGPLPLWLGTSSARLCTQRASPHNH